MAGNVKTVIYESPKQKVEGDKYAAQTVGET